MAYDLTGWSDNVPKDIPLQENGSDCGVFMCMVSDSVLLLPHTLVFLVIVKAAASHTDSYSPRPHTYHTQYARHIAAGVPFQFSQVRYYNGILIVRDGLYYIKHPRNGHP